MNFWPADRTAHSPKTRPAIRHGGLGRVRQQETPMRIIGWMNGWADCPQCWRHFLLRPVHIDRTPAWISIAVLGFVVFLAREPKEGA